MFDDSQMESDHLVLWFVSHLVAAEENDPKARCSVEPEAKNNLGADRSADVSNITTGTHAGTRLTGGA